MGKTRTQTATRPRFTARYQLEDDGLGWTIHIATEAGEFAATATRLQDVELRACQTIRAVLGLEPSEYDLDVEHVLALEKPAPVQ